MTEQARKGIGTFVETIAVVLILTGITTLAGEISLLSGLSTFFNQRQPLTQSLQIAMLLLALVGAVAIVAAQMLRISGSPPPDHGRSGLPSPEFIEIRPDYPRRLRNTPDLDWPGSSRAREAWQAEVWRAHRTRRLALVAVSGGILMVFGLFGFFFLVGSASVKPLSVGGLVYALARLGWVLDRV